MRKKRDEYHTGRLNISCPPSTKDAIAADATALDQSISQYIIGLYEKSKVAGSSEHIARMGLELLGVKKGLVDIDTRLRRMAMRNPQLGDERLANEIVTLREQQKRIGEVLKETLDVVRELKAQGK